MNWLWCPTFVGWLIKMLVQRYLGMKGFRAGIPFFIGLILGDYVIFVYLGVNRPLSGHPHLPRLPI